jgi:hypothetical protein
MIRPILIIALSCFLVTGCGTTSKHLSEGYGVPDLATADLNLQDTLVQRLTTKGEGGQAELVQKACFDALTAQAPNKDTCTMQRNQAIATLMLASDQICMAHRRSIYGNDAIANTTLGTLTNLFAGAATIATGENPKTIYAALALFFSSERSLVNETVYKQMLATAIDQKIEETRATKRAALKQSLQQDISAYPVHQALSDVVDLHNSCSFMTGLQKALAEGTNSHKGRDILLLQQTAALINLEVASRCAKPQTARSNAENLNCDGLKKRYDAAVDALSKAEVSLATE